MEDEQKSYSFKEYLKEFVGIDLDDGNTYCHNCYVPMREVLDSVDTLFLHSNSRWVCPKCGARVERRARLKRHSSCSSPSHP